MRQLHGSFEDETSSKGNQIQCNERLEKHRTSLNHNAENTSPNLPTRTSKIVQELIENERCYVERLEQGIKDFLIPFDNLSLPKVLIGQRLNIFSNIEVIYRLHVTKLYPALLLCDNDPEKIADVFIKCIDSNLLDNYISYVLNSQESLKLINDGKLFFMQLERENLGINSFLIQPVQRLPRYQLLMSELITELIKYPESNKKVLAKCCMAEKKIQKLLNLVNDHC